MYKMPSVYSFRKHVITLWVEYNFNRILLPEFIKKYRIKHYHIGSEEKTKIGKLHHHAVLYTQKKCTKNKVKEIIGQSEAHIEKMVAYKYKWAVDYCDKNSDWRERNPKKPTTKTGGHAPLYFYGSPPEQGKRMDLLKMRDHFEDGKSIREGVLDDIICPTILNHPRSAQMLKLMFTPKRDTMTTLTIYFGEPGTGKSHTAYEDAKKNGSVYFKPKGQWWDGYEQEDTVILEDFRGEISLSQMLTIVDKYPLKVPVKGGFEEFNSKHLIITANPRYNEWWNTEQKGYDMSIRAFERRITKCVKFTEVFVKK